MFCLSASPGGDDFGSPTFPRWMRGLAGKMKIPVENFSLFFIADILFATDVWIKTGVGITPYKDYTVKDVSPELVIAHMAAAAMSVTVLCSGTIHAAVPVMH